MSWKWPHLTIGQWTVAIIWVWWRKDPVRWRFTKPTKKASLGCWSVKLGPFYFERLWFDHEKALMGMFRNVPGLAFLYGLSAAQ